MTSREGERRFLPGLKTGVSTSQNDDACGSARGVRRTLTQAEVGKPAAGPGQVLVRVAASGVNPLDTKIRAGAAAHARPVLPAVLGLDLAGVVEEAGPGVRDFAAGDEVYGLTGGVGGLPGSLAEYAAVDPALLARKPTALTMQEAAALPLAVITAWEGLVDRAQVRRGQQVLVHGGAGGVGHVARYTGGEGFDVIFDSVGGGTLDKSFEAVRAYTGHVVSALGWGTHSLAPLSFRGATYSGIFTLMPMLTGRGRGRHGREQDRDRHRRVSPAGVLRRHGRSLRLRRGGHLRRDRPGTVVPSTAPPARQ